MQYHAPGHGAVKNYNWYISIQNDSLLSIDRPSDLDLDLLDNSQSFRTIFERSDTQPPTATPVDLCFRDPIVKHLHTSAPSELL